MSEEISDNKTDEAGAGDEWGAAMEEQATQEGAGAASATDDASTEEDYEKAAFKDLSTKGQSAGQLTTTENTNLDVILDIPVTLSMEIGRTELPINNLLQLNQGSVVELDRLAGEPLDVLINGTLIAHGEVVVVNEKFGIRLTDVISPAERVKKLR
ncbi:Flagellar motor switch protein FliN [hydrothermal vent metagenome]|uniref:Flagellar motor switch protein FliN n=1 Tax=hydrothermal vent metagenome TaxID=652676 RepID=A0A3B0WA67_9ZZZZ